MRNRKKSERPLREAPSPPQRFRRENPPDIRAERARELSRALDRINKVIHSTLDADRIMQKVVIEATKAIRAEAAVINTVDGEYLLVKYMYNLPEAVQGKRYPLEAIRAVRIAIERKEVVVSNDAYHDERVDRELAMRHGVRSLLAMPLIAKGEALGALVFFHLSVPLPFDGVQVDFARKLASSLSLALENARLYETALEARRKAVGALEISNLLLKAADVLTASIVLPDILDALGEIIAGATGRQRIIVMTLEKATNEVTIRSARGVFTSRPGMRFRLDQFLPRRYRLARRKPFVVDYEAAGVPGTIRKLMTTVYRVRCALFVPLVFGSETIGMISVDEPGERNAFTPRKIRLVEGIASQAATAMENAFLYERRKRAEEELWRMNGRLKDILNSITDAYFALDAEGCFLEINAVAEQSIFRRPARKLIGRIYWKEYPPAPDSEIPRQFRTAMTEGRPVHFESPFAGEDTWFEVHAYPREERLEVYLRDITERKRLEDTVRHQANHDFLTGLPNRMLFMEHLAFSLADARRSRRKLAVMFLDLDRFKNVNDTLGHAAGDQLLKEVAGRLKSCLREEDIIARLGGDEFAVLLPHIARAEDTSGTAQKIIPSFSQPFLLEGHEIHTSISIGISVFPDDSEYEETLLKDADIAMYYAKEQGRNNFQFYNPDLNVRSLERMILENSLRQTLERGELEVFFQPQISTHDGKVVCAEALVRWKHPELGMLNPMQFMPLAEETGLIVPIDEWVLRTACAQNKLWQDTGYPPLCITINLSTRQVKQPDLVETVSQILRDTGMRPEFLEIEVSEHTAMEEIEHTLPKLKKLSRLGVRFSIDDFGTGYTSLSHLKRLPLQRIKIDRSFIRGLSSGSDDRAIVSAVIALAHSLKLRVVAEGVESEAQRAFLTLHGCDEIQGFLVSEPLPPGEFAEFLRLHG